MLEELEAASGLLQIALDRYLRVCSAIQKSYVAKNASDTISQDFKEKIRAEAHTLLDYESKFQEAKAAITWTRNSAALAPAGNLPPEILAQIFRFVLCQEQCSSQREYTYEEFWFSRYPDWLSHVCSHWRQVALGSRELWTHIDIYPEPAVGQRINLRARAYAERSIPLPLYIHIKEFGHRIEYGGIDRLSRLLDCPATSAIGLISYLAPRARSFNITINGGYLDFYRIALESCLRSCRPGVLSRLVIRGAIDEDDFSMVITARDGTLGKQYTREPYGFITLDITEQQLEDTLFWCTSLSFDGIFTPWESKGYRGLTELRLTSYSKPRFSLQEESIPESAFVNILKGSPQLRVLLFGFRLRTPLPASTFVEPVSLPDLETLAIEEEGSSIGNLLRWVAPGTKALTVLIQWNRDLNGRGTFTIGQLEALLARSNVRRLSVAGAYNYDLTKLSQAAYKFPELSLNSDDIDWDELL
ncbi:hypothetical protein RSOLAG1IB_08776 [Rhizoctonia solani AG-1 IB]|uniref:Uncharacterized protein n=1 Tax=Thanatephorus cucumeris (strain AG1-IB / isolate 7/3/14) TaxID=1108050 RepID=A0A0B7FM24_THACB|nr:hypothetical protein RSOLAG1IB_08776 [Rhizoctonia solani AG-1 IB]